MLDFSKNHFELFGLPTGYRVNREQLAERYRELQRVVHPDRYANASDQERRLAVQGASHINEAYRVLKDPLARARYLLGLFGERVDADQQTTADTAFLMEQMELREALAGARSQADPYAAVAAVLGRLRSQRDELVAGIAAQLDDPRPEHLQAAREALCKLQFLDKLRVSAESLEAELDDEQD
jgi:molecular chaperone HscB